MKFLLPLALLTALTGQAQLSVVSPRLTDSSAAVFYTGVYNPIEVRGIDSLELYLASVSGGGSILTMMNPGRYLVRANGPDSVTLSITRRNKLVFQRRYGVNKIPEPRIAVAGSLDSVMERSAIIANPKLECVFPGCLYKMGMEVAGFSVSLELKDEIIEATSPTGIFSVPQRNIMVQAKSGDMLIFDNIFVRGPDGVKRKLVPVMIRLK